MHLNAEPGTWQMSLLLQLLSVIDSTSLKPEQILTHRISYCPSRHPGSAPFTGGGGKELEALSGKESVAKLGLDPWPPSHIWSGDCVSLDGFRVTPTRSCFASGLGR